MFREHDARSIISRAIELEAERQSSLSRDDIVQSIVEVGVSPASVDAAIAERSKADQGAQQGVSWRLMTLGAATGIAVVGLFTGLVPTSTIAERLADELPTLIILGSVVVGIAACTRRRSIRTNLRRCGLFWTGFFAGESALAGVLLTIPSLTPITVGELFPWLVVFAANGLVVTSLMGVLLVWLLGVPDEVKGVSTPLSGKRRVQRSGGGAMARILQLTGRLLNRVGLTRSTARSQP